MSTDLYQLFSLLLFLPGIALMDILNEKFQLEMSFLERIVAGSIAWNFILVSVSVLLGILPHSLVGVFWVFGCLSILLLLVFSVFRLRAVLIDRKKVGLTKRNRAVLIDRKKVGLTKRNRAVLIDRKKVGRARANGALMCFLYLFPIILVSSVIAMFTKISASYDVWAVWLPMAKAITQRGDLLFHSYFLSKDAMAVTPPFVPLAYAWIHSIAGENYRLVPIVYYILFGIASYILSKTLFESEKIALGTTIVSMTSLITLATLFGFALHPDLPLAFFISTSAIYLVKIFKGKTEMRNLLLLGVSLSLMMFTQVIGILISYVLLTFVLLCVSIPYKKALFFIFFLLPFYALILLYPYPLQKLPLLLAYSMILLIIVKRVVPKTSFKMSRALMILLPLLPTLFYFFVIGQSSGIWMYTYVTDPSFLEAFTSLKQIDSIYAPQVQVTTLNLFRLDDIFMRYGLVFYVPLIFVGIICGLRRKQLVGNFPFLLMMMFLCIFLIYPQLFYPSFSPVDVAYIRRYMYLLPPISVLFSKGFFGLSDMFGARARIKNNVKPFILLTFFITYNAFSMFFILETLRYLWPYPLSTIFKISELKISLGWNYVTTPDFMTLTAILFICIWIAGLFNMMHKQSECRPNLKILSSVFLFCLILISSFSTVYSLSRPLVEISIYGATTRDVLPSEREELVSFFKKADGNDIILGYQKYFLITFSDKKVIDLSLTYGFESFGYLFQDAKLNYTLDKLREQNIKYVIEPTNIETKEYKIFSEYRKRFSSFDSLLRSDHLILIKSFVNYNLYTIPDTEEYEE